ncbi:TPA: glycosyltransferase [Vibrio parahaemolyticus]|nr:glycosyltransferase [Vibrio parahaemolyticus]
MLHGNIERLEAGVLYGWAASKENETTLELDILANGKLIGQGMANIYRDDLRAAGIHNGGHAFEISTTELFGLGEEVQITMIERDSKIEIEHKPLILTPLTQDFSGKIIRHEHNHIIAVIESNDALPKFNAVLFVEDEPVHYMAVTPGEAKVTEVRLPIPSKYIDGKPKLFKLGIEGYERQLAMQVYSIHPIQTPWQYIKESYKEPNFSCISPQSGYRYESLQLQLKALASTSDVAMVTNIMTLHDILVEGYEGRTQFPKFSLPKVDSPEVSIIVPAYNKFNLTYHCIASIALAYNKTSYEVILADDCSTDETACAEDIIENVVVSRNPENLRFLRSCNRAAELAKGKFIVFLNNDTEVTSYWLDELVRKHHQDETIGVTGSKLLNLDGSLQEAGGIVWENGQPWNVGRNQNAFDPAYNYCREVDYLTGASMCIRKDVWKEVGGFSEELAPCYYEDTDIAFKVREVGYKTVYVPFSEVVHFEGQSHGTDVTKGLKQYQIVNEKTFRAKWFKQYKNNGKASLKNLELEKDRNIEQRVLVIDASIPTPNKDAGSYAAIQEIKLIQSLGFKVTFVPENLAHLGKYTKDLQRMGIEVLYAPFYSSLYDVITKRGREFDAVYITRYSVAKNCIDLIRQNSSAQILFNNADLHFLREMRFALQQGNEGLLKASLATREQELEVCRKVDAILCYNSTEHAVITSHILEAEKLHITPWVLEDKTVGPSFEEREGLAFLGGFNHTPNGEAVEYLVSDIMPLLAKKRPDIKLYVYGSNMPTSYKDMESDNIKMVGFAETLDGVYHDHRVFVAPLLSGAGIKGKVLESMAYNLPTVLTDVAAEGTGLTHGISTLIAQEPQEWVDAIIKLYDDKTLWTKFAENSQVLVDAKYSAEHGHKVFKDIFASVGIYSTK